MKRLTTCVATVALVLGVAAGNGLGMSKPGAGNSEAAPGQDRAATQCENVWGTIQADLRAGGGPKFGPSIGPIGTYPGGSGPTNCDHFWQGQGAIGND